PTPPPSRAPLNKRFVKPPKSRPAVKSGPPATEAEAVAAKRLEVDRKFQQVKSEYLEFKKNFGARLEDRWQQILSDIALGRRDQSLSDALDALRRDMKRASATNTQKSLP
ncbi:MAG TPA: hypothetical protein PLW65_30355, partial [Pseudomonadota bacterium]|nr:hypothetical protein [Pseudomonadota bacterium]